jgi:ketosteroid isomerase-like protein
MSEVKTLKAVLEAFNRRAFDDVLRYLHSDVELRPALTELDVRTNYVGRADFKQFFETITDAWETYTVRVEEAIETVDGRVVAVERWHARGRQGIEFEFRLTDVYTFRDGLIARVDGFRDKAQALEAVGLSELASSEEGALEAVGLSEQDAHTDS